jgi:hypothetical protein
MAATFTALLAISRWRPSSLLKNLEIRDFLCAGGAVDQVLGAVFTGLRQFCLHERGAAWPALLGSHQFGNADQVVGDQIEQEVGGDATYAAMFGLAHGPVLLAPTEDALGHRPA